MRTSAAKTMPRLLLSLAAAPVAAQAQSFVDPCSRIDYPTHVTGSQVHLRAAPSLDGDIIAAVPWGTCVTFRHADELWGAVTIGGVDGYIDSEFLSPGTAQHAPLPDTVWVDGLCLGSAGNNEPSDPAVARLRELDRAAGTPDYLLTWGMQEHCRPLRPSQTPDLLGTLERSEAAGLNLRLATWTLALAPESAYRRHPSSQVLEASPLFRPFPGHAAPPAGPVPTPDGLVPMDTLFGVSDIAEPGPLPDNVFLLPVLPKDGRLQFLGSERGRLGVAAGVFPSGRFVLSPDLTTARLDRDLDAAVWDPCTNTFVPTKLTDVAYTLGTGRMSAATSVHPRLHACRTANGGSHDDPDFRFLVLIDDSDGHTALDAVLGTPVARDVPQQRDGVRAMEYRWSDDAGGSASLRRVVAEDCSVSARSVLRYTDTASRTVSSPVVSDPCEP